ncbi:MAG: hypothetical protein QOI06_568 [Nocardioidaceae bacterium]|jgi:hypothetical protein|nr:hypothetical protein [Nocardioidaceae bacterium]
MYHSPTLSLILIEIWQRNGKERAVDGNENPGWRVY